MIRYFDEIRKEDVPSVGGKGANLGEMAAAGFPIPPGFVVTADAYRLFLSENGLANLIEEKLREAGSAEAKLQAAAELFREKIRAGKLPQAVSDGIAEGYRKLAESYGDTEPRVAVRSSATAEDLPDASFAGQQETYLNVQGLKDILEHVIACYASLWGGRAVSYRQTQGYDQSQVALAVVIQAMVESETAGVLFTVNPVNRNPQEMQINASYGLGESVVSGRVTPDSYLCDKSGNLLQTTLGGKNTEIVYAENGTIEREVSAERQAARALRDMDIRLLCEQAAAIERHYGCPMDIEWAIRGGKVYILQARAITTLGEGTDPEEEALIEQYLSQCRTSGAMQKNLAFLLEKMPDVFYPFDSEMTAVINNQKSVIFSKVGIHVSMQPLMDDDGIETLPVNGLTLDHKLFHIGGMLRELSNAPHCEQVLAEQMPAFQKELDDIMVLRTEQMDLAACGEAIHTIYDYVRRLSYTRFYYALFPGILLNKRVEKTAKKIHPGITGYEFLQNLDNRTATAARDMAALADTVRQYPDAAAAITAGKNYRAVCESFPEVLPTFRSYLDKYGYTTDYNCYCLHAESLLENPDRMLHILRPLLTMPAEENADKFKPLMEEMKAHLDARKYAKLEENVRCMRAFHVAREESQYFWETAFYQMRRVLERASALCTGDSNVTKSLAFLFYEEVLDVCAKGGLTDADREKIARRVSKRPLAEKVWERAKLLVFEDNGDVLKGVGGSSGEVVGKVCIVSGPEEFYKLQKGDVLVCRLTNPEWTPLFTLASAVVADTGAALSHAAIVAREYGIPAVLSVGFATTKFKDGDMIRVNGSTGEVSRVG